MHRDKREEEGYLDGGQGKAVVLGVFEHGGKAVCYVVENRRINTLQPLVRHTVKTGSTVFTDYHGGYHGLYRDYQHGIVDYEVAYVFGNIHTNNAENYWFVLKRTIRGACVAVPPFHLQSYLDEQSFRFNERKDNESGRFATALGNVSVRRVAYKQLTGKEESVGV